jgi:hypothetical protein
LHPLRRLIPKAARLVTYHYPFGQLLLFLQPFIKHRPRKLLSNDLGVRGKILARRRALLAPPRTNAVVLCCDEKSQCQALECTQTGLPLGEGDIRTRTMITTGMGW